MADEDNGIERFKEDHAENERKRDEIKEVVSIPFEKHRVRFNHNGEECRRILAQIIASRKSNNDSLVTQFTLQYKYLRRQQEQSITKFTRYQRLSIYVDDLFNLLEDSLVAKTLSSMGAQGMERAIAAKKEAAENIWGIEKMREEVETSISTMLAKMNEDSDDNYFLQPGPGDDPPPPDQFDGEIQRAWEDDGGVLPPASS